MSRIAIRKSLGIFFITWSLLSATQSLAQEILELGEYGKVEVVYMLVSERMGDTKAMQISKLDETVDMNEYPDGKLRIKVKVLELKDNHIAYLGPKSVPDELHGFTKTGSYNRYLNKKDEQVLVNYQYAPDRLGKGKSSLAVTVFIKDNTRNTIDNRDGYRSKGQNYTLIPPKPKEEEVSPPKPVADSEAEAWEKAQAQHTKAAYEGFLNAFPSGAHAENAKEQIKALTSPAIPPQPKPDTKKPRKTSDADNLEIKEINRDPIGSDVKVTLVVTGYTSEKLDFTVDPTNVKYEIITNAIILTVPRGIGVVAVTAKLPDVEFPRGNNVYKFDVAYKPLNAKIMSVSEEGKIALEIKEGKPEYQLRFLDDAGNVAKIIKLEEREKQTITRSQVDGLNLLAGSYSLQIVDALGNKSDKAEYVVKTDWNTVIFNALIFAFITMTCILMYVLYQSRRRKMAVVPSEREKIDQAIAQKEQRGSVSAENATKPDLELEEPPVQEKGVTTEATALANPARSKIVVAKRERNIASQPALPAARPQLKRVEEAECRELLLGKSNEYRRIDMLDIWRDSIVSQIYIREVVAYRIHQFVFEENKALKDNRGDEIPEIGGWLLGRKLLDNQTGKYVLTFERFIQMHNPQEHTTTQLTFDADAWLALERAKDIYQDEELERVGWFHTHPGWGVFLSGEDINTHETHFKEPFAIAMELESVKSPHELGFFSRRNENGSLVLNNRAESYHVWKDFQDWLKNG
jgi:proteasome lid subunit RPN8/RPN11